MPLYYQNEQQSGENDDDELVQQSVEAEAAAAATGTGTGTTTTTKQGSSSFLDLCPPVVHRLERNERMPICCILVGMAGSGKSSLLTQLQTNVEEKAKSQDTVKKQSAKKQAITMVKTSATATAIPEGADATTKIAIQPTIEKDMNNNVVHSNNNNNDDGKNGAIGNETNRNDNNDTIPSNHDNNDGDNDTKTDVVDDNDDDNDNENDDDNRNTLYYCMNLDPATLHVEYDVSIDIRDTVNYKQVMKQHKLGPNGAIMTSLNLFATKFDQVVSILEKRTYGDDPIGGSGTTTSSSTSASSSANDNDKENGKSTSSSSSTTSTIEYILVDTPGQIEAFTWSASGLIICESLASAYPTVLVFVIDTVRCASSPNTFMSNMLYACSMMYRTRLPLVVCFNKIDIVSHQFCIEWMNDYETFNDALDEYITSNNDAGGGGSSSTGYYGSLTRSLSLVLDEFYSNFVNTVGVSAITGDGIDEFWNVVTKAATIDYTVDYIDDLKLRIEEQQIRKQSIANANIQRLKRDTMSATTGR